MMPIGFGPQDCKSACDDSAATLLPALAPLAIALHLVLECQRSEDERRLGIENGRPTPETGER
ncbi:hypothetical protein M405DRAFT_826455 [Rhizopogon salebrosus TDB-379]|nr:hypothetical protein M405DRAFT_826455 [Rhizopogon salebrosus TDB-379]